MKSYLDPNEARRRSIAKTVTWRALATLITIALLYAFTCEVQLSLEAGVAINAIKALAYYLHERLWSKIKWGYR